MAIIGKMQEKGRYLLVGFVGLALLTFIFSGLRKCEATSGPLTLGTIGGEAVDEATYTKLLAQIDRSDRMQYQQQQREYTERDADQTADKAWNATVDKVLLDREYNALGINVSDAEFNSYLYGEDGFNLLPEIAQGFVDSITGQFNPKALDKFIEERENAKEAQAITEWTDTKEALREQRKQEKYFQLLSQGVYVTKLEAKEEYTAQKEVKSISFVVRSYRDIPDEQVHVTDQQIRDYFDQHKSEKKYEALAGRDVKYFDITVQPSKADSSAFNRSMDSLKKVFISTPNDSIFVAQNNESPRGFAKVSNPYRSQADPNAKGLTYPVFMDTVFKAASAGQVVGPYNDQGRTFLAKVTGFNTQSLSARHILLPAQKTDVKGAASQKKIADSLAAILNADTTRFTEFVTTYSTDEGSKAKGGKYDDFAKDEFVPEFSNFVIANPVGKIGVVQTDFGFHIIQVLGKKDARIPLLAIIEKTLVPTSETEMELKDQAYDLLFKFDDQISKKSEALDKLNLFDTLAKKEGFFARPVRMLDESPRVSGFNSKLAEQKILELAYDKDAKVGRLCGAPINDKGRYIIAMVSSIREKGEPAFEDVYVEMKRKTIEEKKAEKFKAQIGKERNLEKLAKKGQTIVNSAEVTFANPSIQGGGYEPEVVGSLFSALKDGQTTIPLVGNAGVYVIRLNKTIKAPTAANFDAERTQMLMQVKGNQPQDLKRALQKRAEVYDNRKLREIGIAR